MNKLAIPVGIALLVAGVTFGLLLMRPASDTAAMQPLKPPAGEELRVAAGKPTPHPRVAEPAEALAAAKAVGPARPGDAVLIAALEARLEAKEIPGYKASIDVPLSDNAAPAVKDEVREFITRKMATLGFTEASAKPDITWIVHVDPGEAGKYLVAVVLRSGGAIRFEGSYELPAAVTPRRVDAAFAAGFTAP